MPDPRIERIELIPIFVPFRERVLEAMRSGEGGLGMAIAAEEAWLGGDFVIARLYTDTGHEGLGAALHNQPLGIATSMHIHLAAAKHAALGHATELFGHVMLEDDLIVKRLELSGGRARVPEGAGWGVELDEEALGRYATGPPVVLEATAR